MAQWHLDEIEAALLKNGWRLVAKLPGDNYNISATWQFERSCDPATVHVDFNGLDDMTTQPIERAYACEERGTSNSLYFSKLGKGTNAREVWQSNLHSFIAKLGMRKPTSR